MDLSFAASAYELGGAFGTVLRWVLLVAIAVVTVQRLRAGRYSRLRAGATLAIVGGLLVASMAYDLGGGAEASAAERNLKAGCLNSGAPESFCSCLWDEFKAAGYDS